MRSLNDVALALAAAGISNPRLEARLLVGHALNMDQATLLRERDRRIDPAEIGKLLQRRLAREPLALILGKQEFWTLSLATSAVTLVPRADSETLIEAALAAFPQGGVRHVLDLGTGTGCLLLAALDAFPDAFGVGVDIVPQASALAARNAAANGLADRAVFLCGDWGAALQARFDLVLCNPPYIPTAEIAGLMPEVACHEPASALDGGADGYDAYRMVIDSMPLLLRAGGVAIIELGLGQAAQVQALAAAIGFEFLALRSDLGGIPRALALRNRVP